MNAETGETLWRYDTELPIGHSPTVVNGVVYFGGLDKKMHALNAETGAELWNFAGARAGFYVNPLVVEGKVFAGNRDGRFYGLDASDGSLLWTYPRSGEAPLGPIVMSAAYDDEGGQGTIYFSSNDMYAYAISSADGSLIWRSATKLTGERIHSYYPVVYNNGTEDLVVFASSASYKTGTEPGTMSAGDGDYVNGVQRDDVFAGLGEGAPLGPINDTGAWGWPSGITVMDASRILEYLEQPTTQESQQDPNLRNVHKPWRRTTIYLRQSDGT